MKRDIQRISIAQIHTSPECRALLKEMIAEGNKRRAEAPIPECMADIIREHFDTIIVTDCFCMSNWRGLYA